MKFVQALEAMKNGLSIKLPNWTGYWKIEGDTVMMHCRGGEVIDVRNTEDALYTLQNIASEEWEIVGSEAEISTPALVTMSFSEALRKAKHGCLIARVGWNGKGMSVAYQPGYPDGIPCNRNTAETWHIPEGTRFRCRPYMQLRCADGTYQMWTASQSDILADDWYVVE